MVEGNKTNGASVNSARTIHAHKIEDANVVLSKANVRRLPPQILRSLEHAMGVLRWYLFLLRTVLAILNPIVVLLIPLAGPLVCW
jgi:flagella basal body P-ring formation protein FlgA